MLKRTDRLWRGSGQGRHAKAADGGWGAGIAIACMLASFAAWGGETPYSPLWYMQNTSGAGQAAGTAEQMASGIVGADLTKSLAPPVARSQPAAVPHLPTSQPVRISSQWRRYISQLVQKAAQENHLEPALLYAVIRAESAYNPNAVSRKGAIGLMQVMPFTGRRFGVTNLYNPEENIKAGARYLGFLMKMFNNNRRLTIAAYNAGEQAVVRYGYRLPPFRETTAYVPRVLSYYRQYLSGALGSWF